MNGDDDDDDAIDCIVRYNQKQFISGKTQVKDSFVNQYAHNLRLQFTSGALLILYKTIINSST